MWHTKTPKPYYCDRIKEISSTYYDSVDDSNTSNTPLIEHDGCFVGAIREIFRMPASLKDALTLMSASTVHSWRAKTRQDIQLTRHS
jgi:hypothetical protein